jgi:hypothetical protein
MVFVENQIEVQLSLFIASIVFLFLFVLLINKSFTNITISGENLILKSPFFPKKIYTIKQLKEIALFDYQNHKPQNSMQGNTPQAVGRNIGLGLLTYAKRAPRNNTFEKQFMAKYSDNKVITIITNFIDDSNQLIEEIKSISGLEYTSVTFQNYKEWRK